MTSHTDHVFCTHTQTQRRGALAEEALRIANGILSRSSSSPYPKPTKGSKDDAKIKDPKKGVGVCRFEEIQYYQIIIIRRYYILGMFHLK